MKKLQFPSALTVLVLLAALVAGLTWLIPSGEFDRLSYDKEQKHFVHRHAGRDTILPANQGTLDRLGVGIPLEKFTSGDIWKPVAVPGSYRPVEGRPQGFVAFLQAPLKGIVEAIDVILFVLILGGCIGAVHQSGAFDAGVGWLARRLQGREALLIVVITCLITAGGTTFGMAEETIAFYPILVPVFLAAGYDAMVALAAIYIGSSLGTMASTVNPFSVIIASDTAGTSWVNGIEGRLVMLFGGLAICLWYIIRYAEKVRREPARSLIFSQKDQIDALFPTQAGAAAPAFTHRIRLVLLVFVACFVVMIYGVSRLEWWFLEMTTVFLAGALLIGFISRVGEKTFVNAFVKGASDLLGVALIIGVARGVTVLMERGLISDTLLYHASSLVEGMPKALFVNATMLLYAGLSFFIPSSSGMAVLTMPIMAPLADVVGTGREMVVSAYAYGQGLFAFINPTSLILASLAMVEVGFNKWLRFVGPLLVYLLLLTMVVLTVGVYL